MNVCLEGSEGQQYNVSEDSAPCICQSDTRWQPPPYLFSCQRLATLAVLALVQKVIDVCNCDCLFFFVFFVVFLMENCHHQRNILRLKKNYPEMVGLFLSGC